MQVQGQRCVQNTQKNYVITEKFRFFNSQTSHFALQCVERSWQTADYRAEKKRMVRGCVIFLPGPALFFCLALPGCSLARFAILLVHICIRIFPPERNSATQWITAHFSLSFRSVGSSYFHSMSVPTSAAEIRDRPRIDRRRGTREGEASPRPLQDNYYRVAEMVTWYGRMGIFLVP